MKNLKLELYNFKKELSLDQEEISFVIEGHMNACNELSEKAIRAAYRKKALDSPVEFVDSFNDKTLDIKYYIGKAMQDGLINYNKVPNSACWKSGSVICDVSGIKSSDGVSNRLLEYSQTADGEEFLIQLKSLYSK